MAITHNIYRGFFESVFNKEIDFDSDIIKVMLVGAGYTPDQAAHRYKSSVTNEASGPGYTAGGVTLGTASISGSGKTVTLKGDNVSWPSSTVSGRYLVIYDATPGSDAQRPLISYVDFGETVSSTSAAFQATWNTLGILSVSVA
ncbi:MULTISPECIES: hypothetical protein [Gordonia]|uniref:Uncharacterized protein n=1 Tax=Gordonia sihwensis NBRC 108236 TaxID=1223544 RepID=L7LMU3_9ACTN|nr:MULTISPECIES: hypothetical protein [Gordonia]AUH68534.1 hypothetical protein CXX93_09420 [Gordonia sp. YC-JH1]GAC62204.1 hypothetical protein GSI01S_30_00120 [Gordonia sihwensis NBRC 108236]